MVLLFIGSFSVSCVIMALGLSGFQGEDILQFRWLCLECIVTYSYIAAAIVIPSGRFCAGKSSKYKYIPLLWIPMLVFETFLCYLAVVRGIKMRRSQGPTSFYQSGQRLIDVLFRDSIIYFVAYVFQFMWDCQFKLLTYLFHQYWCFVSNKHHVDIIRPGKGPASVIFYSRVTRNPGSVGRGPLRVCYCLSVYYG